MKLYALKNDDGLFAKSEVYRNKEAAKEVAELVRDYQDLYLYVEEYEVNGPVGDQAFYISVYNGYDYTTSGIDSMIEQSGLYSSVDLAKSDVLWKDSIRSAEKNPSKYIISDKRISSDNGYGMPWDFGDIFEEKFDTKILQMSVK